jgi:hypothetical protein
MKNVLNNISAMIVQDCEQMESGIVNCPITMFVLSIRINVEVARRAARTMTCGCCKSSSQHERVSLSIPRLFLWVGLLHIHAGNTANGCKRHATHQWMNGFMDVFGMIVRKLHFSRIMLSLKARKQSGPCQDNGRRPTFHGIHAISAAPTFRMIRTSPTI